MTQKNETPILILSLLITIGVIGGGLWFFNQGKLPQINQNSQPSETSTTQIKNPVISTGNQILITQDSNQQKQAAISALNQGNYTEAITFLEQSLATQKNDPEALIYLNNARISNSASYTLVASVPISSNVNIAKEILRGVAQAQDQINKDGGIAGKPIKIAIADDGNNKETAQQLAKTFAQDSSILGVIGHFSSEVTLAAAPVYEENGLVVISPTSTSIELSGVSKYVFRTVPSDKYAGNALAKYFLQTLQQRKAAIIYSSESSYSKSLYNIFRTEVISSGGEVVAEFDFSQPNFNVAGIVQQVQQAGAEALVLFPSSAYPDTINSSLAIVQINNGKLSLLGGDSLYRAETLQITGKSGIGMTLAVPWHILNHMKSVFPQDATRLWGGNVNWRTALAYDATQALAQAIGVNPTRQGIQEALTASDFRMTGASGKVKFLASGDRDKAVELVQIQLGNSAGYDVEFQPIP